MTDLTAQAKLDCLASLEIGMDCGLRGKDRAEWLADKIPAYGDYAKEAALVLRQQAEEIDRLRNLLIMVADEPNIDKARAMADAEINAEITGRTLAQTEADAA